MPDFCHGDDFDLSRVFFKCGEVPNIFLSCWGDAWSGPPSSFMEPTLAKVGMRKNKDRRLQKKGVDDGQLTVVWMEDPRVKFSFSVVLGCW